MKSELTVNENSSPFHLCFSWHRSSLLCFLSFILFIYWRFLINYIFTNEEPPWVWYWEWEKFISTRILSDCCDLGKLEMAGHWVRTKNEGSKMSRVQPLRRHSLSGLYKHGSTSSVVFWTEFLTSLLSSLLLWIIREHRSGRLVQVSAILTTKQSFRVSTFIFYKTTMQVYTLI